MDLLELYKSTIGEIESSSAGSQEIFISDRAGIRAEILNNISAVIEKSMTGGFYPGAVILAAYQGEILYKGVFGYQSIIPQPIPMRETTIFDVASLTKVIVTTTAVMQLLETGALELDLPVYHYWPEFAENSKDKVTLRHLLTHTSGLPAIPPVWTPPADPHEYYSIGLNQIAQASLINQPGRVFVYGDTNFIILGHLVERLSGQSLQQYAQTHIFTPLQMNSAVFLPPESLKDLIAPTGSPDTQEIRHGIVNDPTTLRMGGVSGAAGLFCNAEDLGIFLQCLLKGGQIKNGKYLLSPLSIKKMISPQTPAEMPQSRGLGWDIDSIYSNRGVLLPISSFGHSGWTGVSMWADPLTQISLVILTSRSHPALSLKNQLLNDRRVIANIIAASLTDPNLLTSCITGEGELQRAYEN